MRHHLTANVINKTNRGFMRFLSSSRPFKAAQIFRREKAQRAQTSAPAPRSDSPRFRFKRAVFSVVSLSALALSPAFASAQTWDTRDGAVAPVLVAPAPIYGSSSYSYCIFGQGCFQSPPPCQLLADGTCAQYVEIPTDDIQDFLYYGPSYQAYRRGNYPRDRGYGDNRGYGQGYGNRGGVSDQSNYWQGNPNDLGGRANQNRGQSYGYTNDGVVSGNRVVPYNGNGVNVPSAGNGVNVDRGSNQGAQIQQGGGAGAGNAPRGNEGFRPGRVTGGGAGAGQ